MPLLRLFRQFILRSLGRGKARSAAAVLGVAVGVAVMVAIRLANTSVTDAFRAAVDAVGGEASLRIRGAAGRFDELRLPEIDWLADERGAVLSPVITTHAMLVDDRLAERTDEVFPRGELLQVLGVDVLADFDLRDYQVLKTSAGDTRNAREVLALLDDPRSIILTEKFLRRHGLRVGDGVRLTFASTPDTYTIRGVLLNRGPARTLDGNFALMDIAAAQLAADRLGLVDHVDVRLGEGEDLDAALSQIQQRLPTGLVVERPDASAGRTDTMIDAFQFNLEALSAVALVVGLFLVYNTVAMSVAARRDEIGLLQAAGAGRRAVLALFLGEALVLAAAGLLLGLPLGRLLASYAVRGAAQTVETFYIAGVAEASASQLQMSLGDVLTAAALTIPLALVAALAPAWEAASVAPVEAARGGGTRASASRLRVLVAAALACLAAGFALTRLDAIDGKPVFGFAAELLLLLGGAMLTPLALAGACRAVAWCYASFALPARAELRLATANLLGSLGRVSVSVAALAVALSMMMAIAIMVGSFRTTVTYWLESALSADLAVKPVMQSSAVSESRMSPRAVEIIRGDPGVEEALWVTTRQTPVGDRTIRLAVTELGKALPQTSLLFKRPPPPGLVASGEWDAHVLVSESYQLLFGADVGDAITLPTAAGPAEMTIAGVYFDYSSNQGAVLMDLAAYRRLYSASDPNPMPQSLSIRLKEGANPVTVRTRIVSQLGPDEQLYCVTNDEIRTEAMRIFESTFTVTYALQAIAIVVAGLGVASTLVTLIYERQRELGLMSLVGATARQVRRVVLFEAVILGAASQAVGILLGVVLAAVLVFVINVQSFGWTIQFHLPWAFFGVASLLVIGASALFGLYPAVRAASVNPLETVREL